MAGAIDDIAQLPAGIYYVDATSVFTALLYCFIDYGSDLFLDLEGCLASEMPQN